VDRGQIEQVLLNLLLNAWQAIPGGGAIYLETRNVHLDESYVAVHEIPPGPYVKISVTDTGVGMDEKTKQPIFEPFFTTKDMGHGSGLGLATTYGIIKGHRGIINVYSEKGHGSTFDIYLPASGKEVDRQQKSAPPLHGPKRTILLVDDEKPITEVAGAMLKRLGHEVLIARSGEEAIRLYKGHRNKIELVIMDMIMPDMGGSETIDRIRLINPEVKIILPSGYSLNSEAREIINRGGVQAFLQKPFQLEDLVNKINEVMEKGFSDNAA
jgi:CheY-like chemotaxis protein